MCEQKKHPAPEIAGYAALIHYPEHWDTAAYPTLESAVRETLAWAGCSACKEPEAHGLDPEFVEKAKVVLCGTPTSEDRTREPAFVLIQQAGEIERLRQFAMEVRRSGDTRLASMAIAVMSQDT